MTTRITTMLLLAVACAANAGCACMNRCTSCDTGSAYCGFECASCGSPEASCCCPDDYGDDTCCASCGSPEASCCAPEEASCCAPEASCRISDASCGYSAGGCDTVGCGSPVMGRSRLMQRICNAFHGRSNCSSGGCTSEAYWSEWQNDPPCNCQACSQGTGLGHRAGYSSPQRRRSELAKRNVNLDDELRFAERTSGTSRR